MVELTETPITDSAEVKFQLASIFRKLNVANRTEATAPYVSALAAQQGAQAGVGA